MLLKWIGGLCILVGCSSAGFLISANQRREERCLRALISVIEYMICELEYRLTPLPELCKEASQQATGSLGRFFEILSQELEDQISPDVTSCVNAALSRISSMPQMCGHCLEALGMSLGRFDIGGQLKEMNSVKLLCKELLDKHCQNKEQRYRSYQTLGICAGAGLAILFI